jgi:hypothetical protein
MCQIQKMGFLTKKWVFCPFFRPSAQGFAQVAQALMRKVFALGLAVVCLSCTGPIRDTPKDLNHADAVLVSGKSLFVFDFGHSRFQKWPIPDRNGSHACGLIDTLTSDWSAPSHWLALASPVQPFQPSQAISGPNGHFFLLDRGSKRLALYDTNAQFLSGFPLPPEIRDRNLNRVDVFWTRDGLFSFIDRDEGRVWKYTELRSQGGTGDWQLRYTLKLSLGLDACLWEPYFKSPRCLSKSTGITFFDDYFNATADSLNTLAIVGIKVLPSADKTGWNYFIPNEKRCGTGLGFIFSADFGGFYPLPDSRSPQPGFIPLLP